MNPTLRTKPLQNLRYVFNTNKNVQKYISKSSMSIFEWIKAQRAVLCE